MEGVLEMLPGESPPGMALRASGAASKLYLGWILVFDTAYLRWAILWFVKNRIKSSSAIGTIKT